MKREYIQLNEAANWGNKRVKVQDIELKQYVSTENLIADRGGKVLASNLPDAITIPAFEKNDILISNIRPYFKKIYFADEFGGCSNDVLVVKANKEYNPEFLYYVLSDNNFFNYATVTSKGTKMPRGSKHAIMKYLVPNISKAEQEKIANILSTYDKLIENNNRRINILEQAAEELYKEWFVRMRFPGHENAKFVNGIPVDWNISKVKMQVNRLPFGTLYKSNDTHPSGKVIVIDQSQDAFVGYHNNEPSHIASIDNPIAIFGDHSCKFQLMICPFSLSENVIPYMAKENTTTIYLYYSIYRLIETTEYKRHWSELMGKKILIAPMGLQKCFGDHVSSLLLNIELLKNQNQNLIKQRDLLLPRLMSGKMEV